MPLFTLKGPARGCDRINFYVSLNELLSEVSKFFKIRAGFQSLPTWQYLPFPVVIHTAYFCVTEFDLKESPAPVRRSLLLGLGCIPPGICQRWMNFHPNAAMPPQEAPPADRVYPDDPDLLLRDLEELPPITEPPAKQPHSRLAASHPKSPPGDKSSPRRPKMNPTAPTRRIWGKD